MGLFKKPITVGKLLILTLLMFFIGVFFLYITIYSFNYFWYQKNPEGIFVFSAAFGFIILIVGSIWGSLYFLFTHPFSKIILKIWNYPVIK